jgi:hypothetical protein
MGRAVAGFPKRSGSRAYRLGIASPTRRSSMGSWCMRRASCRPTPTRSSPMCGGSIRSSCRPFTATWRCAPRPIAAGPKRSSNGPKLARERIAERVRDRQHHAWNKAKRTGLSFVGPRRVLRLAHTKRAKSYEVFGSLNPQFAAAGNRAAATEAVKRLRAFKAQYARALAAWTAGNRRACFPVGTWWMRVCHGARCGPGP